MKFHNNSRSYVWFPCCLSIAGTISAFVAASAPRILCLAATLTQITFGGKWDAGLSEFRHTSHGYKTINKAAYCTCEAVWESGVGGEPVCVYVCEWEWCGGGQRVSAVASVWMTQSLETSCLVPACMLQSWRMHDSSFFQKTKPNHFDCRHAPTIGTTWLDFSKKRINNAWGHSLKIQLLNSATAFV